MDPCVYLVERMQGGARPNQLLGTLGSLWRSTESSPGSLLRSLVQQIAQSRSYLYTLGPKVGIIYMLGALGV